MKKGDKVRINNPDSSFYNREGTVVSEVNDKSSFVRVFIKEEKLIHPFMRYDLKVINRRMEG